MLAIPAARAKDPATPVRKGPFAPAPLASSVVVRRQADLAGALQIALAPASTLGPKAVVSIVLDPTPEVKASAKGIVDALASLSSVPGRPTAWQVGSLGGSLSSPTADPASLGGALREAIDRRGKATPDTIGLLRKSVRKAAGESGVVVYLASGHFEDDVDLEGLVAELKSRKRVLCVLGPEAAFESSWGDVVADVGDWSYKRGNFDSSIPGVGNRPFGPEDPTAPWRGGDTAYPLAPLGLAHGARFERRFSPTAVGWGRFSSMLHRSKDPPDPSTDPDGFERWARLWVTPPERIANPDGYRAWLEKVGPPPGRTVDAEAQDRWFTRFLASAPVAPLDLPPIGSEAADDPPAGDLPVPSGFGPYGLSRAAGASGGRYVLWSWTRARRGDAIRYDYARLNDLAPDLRARPEILADLQGRVLARALLHVWADLADAQPALVVESPPWRSGQPAAVTGILSTLYLVGIIDHAAERDEEVAEGRTSLGTIERAIDRLAEAVKSAGPAKDGIDRRLRADVDLSIHALEIARFHMKEYVAAAASIPDAYWKGKNPKPAYLESRDWVAAADDTDPVATVGAPPREAAVGQAVVAARKAFLEKYRQTPYGAIIARNVLVTFDLRVWDYKPGPGSPPPPKGKGSSGGKVPPATGGSSGAPGATTGK